MTSGIGIPGKRSSTDFAGASERRRARKARIATNNGDTMPDRASAPRPPPLLILHDVLRFEGDDEVPEAVYGQYPRGLIAKLLPWLGCARHEVLHVCSGSLPPGEGIRVDIRPDAKPDILADGRKLPIADGTIAAVMLDPPYSEEYAASLYGVEYPRTAHLLAEAARVVRPGGRIVLVHYHTPRPPPGTRLVKVIGLSTGFNYPMRAISVYERDQPRLDL
jgi:hypothetical protein